MAKKVDWKELERRREAVRRGMAQRMTRWEIAEALVKEGLVREGAAGLRAVERDMGAIRREEARSPRMEYIRRLEEIRTMAMSGEKPDWKVAVAVTEKIAKAQGVDTGDVKMTRETVAALPRWHAVMKRCAVPKLSRLKAPEKSKESGNSEKAENGKA